MARLGNRASTLQGLSQDVAHHVCGDGEADADIALVGAEYGRVDADHSALRVDQRTARIAGIYRSVRLNQPRGVVASGAAVRRAHDAGGDGLAQTERIPDRDDIVADGQFG